MAKIVPAILEKEKTEFLKKVGQVTKLPGVVKIQVDFGDGEFVPDKLLDSSEMDTLNPAFQWEAHLMVKNPSDFLDLQICGFKTVILHFEAFASRDDLNLALHQVRTMGMKCGLAINPETPAEALKGFEADQFLIMGVHPGRQGNEFIPETLEKVKQIRAIYPHAIIEVDGGVNETNIKSVKEAGADLICVGSALVKAEDVGLAYEKLLAQIT
jgi:ribulose-phosphate 3-epimerase